CSRARFHAPDLSTEIFQVFGLRQQCHEVLVLPICRSKCSPLEQNDRPGEDGKDKQKQQNDFRHYPKRTYQSCKTDLKHWSTAFPTRMSGSRIYLQESNKCWGKWRALRLILPASKEWGSPLV